MATITPEQSALLKALLDVCGSPDWSQESAAALADLLLELGQDDLAGVARPGHGMPRLLYPSYIQHIRERCPQRGLTLS